LRIRVLSEDQVRALIGLPELLDALAQGFVSLSAGEVVGPARNQVQRPDGFLLCMPGHTPGADMAVKVVTVYEGNPQRDLPVHLATIGLYDPDTGACRAFMDGTYVTAIRTAAAAALSTRLLARDDARTLTIVGTGVQGVHHLQTFPLTRDFAEIRIAGTRADEAERLAAEHPRARPAGDLEADVRDADVVALATNAPEPVIAPEWVAPGTHVTSVGYRPPAGELPPALAADASLFVETRRAFEPPPVGCAELQGLDAAAATELGEVVAGDRPGRRSADEVTVYKSMGHVVEDSVAAQLAFRAADARGVGEVVDL
jgi:ornithine cyclodeaminase/alanine dehydrogenase-like protein (mu-crystallin family)